MTGIYVRVSTQDQVENGYPIEEQINLLINYCISNNLNDYRIYIDKGISASTMERRELKRLMYDIEIDEISKVLVYRLDRISRNSKDTEYLMNFFYQNNCDFISLNENFKYNTASGNNQMRIISANNQLDSELSSERTKIGLIGAAKLGHVSGTPIYGYYRKDKGFIIDENKAIIVELIFKMFLGGKSIPIIREKLNFQFALNFTNDRIRRILINEKYIGNNIAKSGIFKDVIPRIIEDDIFLKAREILTGKKRNSGKHQYVFQNLIYCNKCMKKLKCTSSTKKRNNKVKRYYFYYCFACKSKYMNQEKIILKNKRSLNAIYHNYQIYRESLTSKEKFVKKDVSYLKLKLTLNNEKIQRLINLYMDQMITEIEFDRQYKFLKSLEFEYNGRIKEFDIKIKKRKTTNINFSKLTKKQLFIIMQNNINKVFIDVNSMKFDEMTIELIFQKMYIE